MGMSPEPRHLGRLITGKTGLAFEADSGTDADGQTWYLLRPRGLPTNHCFGIRTTLGWRRLYIVFEPGKFAGELLASMGNADNDGRSVFRAVLKDCQRRDAEIKLSVNGSLYSIEGGEAWSQDWSQFSLSLNKGQLEPSTDDGALDPDTVSDWTGRFAAAITAILPLEEEEGHPEEGIRGLPEGAVTTVQANRYERDRRNRAAAISIHGSACRACGVDMGKRYGNIATDFIEVHHLTPLSKIGDDYTIDPALDLVPLCPNCHAIAHRRDPPFSVEEISAMLV